MTSSSLSGNGSTCGQCSGEGAVTVQVLCQSVLAMDSSSCAGCLLCFAVGTHPG